MIRRVRAAVWIVLPVAGGRSDIVWGGPDRAVGKPKRTPARSFRRSAALFGLSALSAVLWESSRARFWRSSGIAKPAVYDSPVAAEMPHPGRE